jgi:hypothetical protein
MVAFPQVSPPKSCMHLSFLPHVLHVPPISFFDRCRANDNIGTQGKGINLKILNISRHFYSLVKCISQSTKTQESNLSCISTMCVLCCVPYARVGKR